MHFWISSESSALIALSCVMLAVDEPHGLSAGAKATISDIDFIVTMLFTIEEWCAVPAEEVT